MMSLQAFHRTMAGAVMAASALGAPAAVMAQDARYVPAYEPSYMPASYSLADAYGAATISLSDAYGLQQVKPVDAAPQVTLAADAIAPRLTLASNPAPSFSDLQPVPGLEFDWDVKLAQPILLASNR